MKTILLIDDDEPIREMFAPALRSLGYDVAVASDAVEGFTKARKYLPDLILSDINMPDINGCTLLSRLRSDPELTTKQIVLMTGNHADNLHRTSMNLGADDFLSKPFTIEELDRCITARMKRAEISRRVEDKALQALQSTLRSTMPHEFFTPLTGILGLVELLQTDLGTLQAGEIRGVLRDIQRSGLRLHRTLRNYLTSIDLQHSAGSSFAEALEPVNLQPIIQSVVAATLERHDRANDISIHVVDCMVQGNPNDIAIIVEELLDNAFAYSRKGTEVSVTLTAGGACVIRDHGRGMTLEQTAQISAFRQFDRKRFEQQGLGLGLRLVQHLVERQRARFSLQSQLGIGTSARVEFWPACKNAPDLT
jgi:signal transduction histidine kinase